MKAIRFAAPIPTYVATLAAGAIADRLYVGPLACTRYGDVPRPALPTDRWVRIRTRLGGICGSDLAIITLKTSPSTSPFSSFPFVLGHENVGEVVEVGAGVRSVTVGDRVVANPLLCCEARALEPPCAACAAGEHARCAHFTDGAIPPGVLIGTTRGLGGSWGEEFVAHDALLARVPANMPDEAAVLIEPFACALHAVHDAASAAPERVLVIGAGSIGLMVVAALRALAPSASITVLARHEFQARHARALGAAEVVMARGAYTGLLADAAGARLLTPIIGPPVGVGGVDRSYVCVTGTRAMADAMRVTREGGTIELLGNVGTLNGLDWTPIWLKELTLRGSVNSGVHHPSPPREAFDEAVRLVASGAAPIQPLLTHTFALDEYRRALATAMDRGESESVKVAFRF